VEARFQRMKKILLITSIMTIIVSFFILPQILIAQEEGEETTTTIKIVPAVTFDLTFPELKAKSGAQFEFKGDMLFVGEEETTFDITAEAPTGWYVSIQSSYDATEVSAIKLKPDKKESLKFIAIPLVEQEPGEYIIKIKATSDLVESEVLELKAIVTATYELVLTPTNSMYNMDATSGKDNHFALQLKNTGSADIEKITFNSSGPEGWTIKFNPSEIEKIEPGKIVDIDVKIVPPDKTIAGDYMVNVKVSSKESSPDMDLRVTVETPTVWGWVGIGIIVIVIVGVAIIFAKLGRR